MSHHDLEPLDSIVARVIARITSRCGVEETDRHDRDVVGAVERHDERLSLGADMTHHASELRPDLAGRDPLDFDRLAFGLSHVALSPLEESGISDTQNISRKNRKSKCFLKETSLVYDNTKVSKMEINRRDVTLEDVIVIASVDPLQRGRKWLAWGE